MSISIPLSRTKSAALSRILDMVPKGYTFYTAGEVSIQKLERLITKFHERYGIGCSPAQRITRKQKGLANASLVVFWPAIEGESGLTGKLSAQLNENQPDQLSGNRAKQLAGEITHPATFQLTETGSVPEVGEVARQLAEKPGVPLSDGVPGSVMVSWCLLVTKGSGLVREAESLKSVTERRLIWLGYELVRHPVRGSTCWTWRRPKEVMAEWYALLGELCARRHTKAVAEALERMARQPGFAGVREQGWQLCEFARQRGYAGELPQLFFMQKVSHGERVVVAGSNLG